MWVCTLTVLTGVGATVAMTGATTNAIDSTVASFSSVADADVWVSASPASEYPTAPLLPADTQSKVSAVPGVESVVPGQMAFATVGETRIAMMGVAPGTHRKIYQLLSTQNQKTLDAGEGVALSRDLSQVLGVSAGEEIALQTPSGVHHMRVLQVIPFFSGLTGTMAINLNTMQQWFFRPGATYLEITAAANFNPQSVKAAVKEVVSKSVYVYSGPELLAGIKEALDMLSALFTIIAWIVVTVSAIALLNTFMLSVLDRRREIGVMRALGATRRFTTSAVIAEAAGICVVGGALGLGVGAAIQFLIDVVLTNILSIDVIYRPQPAIILIGLGALVVCLLGSLPPAVRAARINIVEAVAAD
jgi:putative ABC transport system permease protein